MSAATTPMIPRVIKTSAKVKATRLAARRLGSEAARFLDAKMPRGIDAWSVSGELFSFFAEALYCNKLDSFA